MVFRLDTFANRIRLHEPVDVTFLDTEDDGDMVLVQSGISGTSDSHAEDISLIGVLV